MNDTHLKEIDIFISHSSKDKKIVEALVTLLRSSLNISSKKIRASSIAGYRFGSGTEIDDQIRLEIEQAKIMLVVMTKNSLESAYVQSELGARWGSKKMLIPIIAYNTEVGALPGPIKSINSVAGDNPGQVHQLIDDIAAELGVERESTASFQKEINAFVALSSNSTGKIKLKNKALIGILLAAIFCSIATLIVIEYVPGWTAVEIEVFATRINFSLSSAGNPEEVQVLHSGIWTNSVKLEGFQPVELVLNSLHTGKTDFHFTNPIRVLPEHANATISFSSAIPELFLQQLVCQSGSSISLAKDSQNISITVLNSSNSPYGSLSLSDSVQIATQGCKVFDASQKEITQVFQKGVKTYPHDLSRSLNFRGGSRLKVFVNRDKTHRLDPALFMIEQSVQGLDFSETIHQGVGKTMQSTIDSISVKQKLLGDITFTSHEPGDLVLSSDPVKFRIYNLLELRDGLRVRAQNQMNRLQVGQGILKRDLIPLYLSLPKRYPIRTVIMIWLIGSIFIIVLVISSRETVGQRYSGKEA